MGSGGELWLPEPAIERIQDFLNPKEAAQTMILSKSWYNVSLNRPNINFDYDHHRSAVTYEERMKRFLEFANKTLHRYHESNLKIQSFKLCMKSGSDYALENTQLILRAFEFGVTHLTLHLRYGSGFVLPDEVFECTENLTVIRCDINRKPLVTCNSRLQSLSLDDIEFKKPDTISHILLSCPLIQYLSLYNVSLVKPYDFRDGDFGGYYDDYPTDDYGYFTCKPHMRLTTLVLKYVYFDMLFLGDLSSKFPMLKDLTLSMRLKKYQEEVRISSTSLERLNFKLNNNSPYTRNDHPYKRQKVTFDFPSIRKFSYAGSVIPLLSLESNSRGYWESYLSITRREKFLTTSWFRRLRDLLTKLRRSRVSLFLRVRSVKSFDYEAADMQSLPTCKIEKLIIHLEQFSPLPFYALLDGLFRVCHPKLITLYVSKCFRVKRKHIELLGQILLNGVLLDHDKIMLTPSHFMYGLNDLKDATAQIIDNSAASTQRGVYVPLDALSGHLKSAKGKQEVRFHLNWQPTTNRKKFDPKMSSQKIEELEIDRVSNPDWERGFSTIEEAKYLGDLKTVSETILENSGSGELVGKIKHLLKLLQDGFLECVNVDDANKFSCLLYEVFQEPCFVNAVRSSIEKEDYRSMLVTCAEVLSNDYLPMERVAHMKADCHFKHTLMSLRSDTTNFNTIRFFLSMLFGHWSDEGELRDLDKRILGKRNHFGDHFDLMVARPKLSHLDRRSTSWYCYWAGQYMSLQDLLD